MQQPDFPFLIPGWRRSLIMMFFSWGERFVFRAEQTILNDGEEDEPVRSNAAQAEKTAQGLNPARGCIFKKWSIRHFFRLNEEMMG